jgi:hypothetical protein
LILSKADCLGVEKKVYTQVDWDTLQGGWPGPRRAGEHLLAAAAAQAVLLLDLRRPALPLLTWPHGARPVSRAPLEGCPQTACMRSARS